MITNAKAEQLKTLIESAITDIEKLKPVIGEASTALADIYREALARVMKPETPETQPGTIITSIERCARCGLNHETITFRPLARPADNEFTHWTMCPATYEPIMMKMSPCMADGVTADLEAGKCIYIKCPTPTQCQTDGKCRSNITDTSLLLGAKDGPAERPGLPLSKGYEALHEDLAEGDDPTPIPEAFSFVHPDKLKTDDGPPLHGGK